MNHLNKYEIIEYKESYLSEILKLFSLIHDDYMDEKLWEWKYFNQGRKTPQILMAMCKGKVVGIQPAFFNKINIKDKETYGCMLADVMTHPAFRRKGVFSILIKESMKRAFVKGIPLIYTFPNEQSLPGFIKKLEWHHIFSIPLYVKVLNIRSLAEELTRLKAARTLSYLLTPIQKKIFRENQIKEDQYEISECAELYEREISSLFENSLSKYPLTVIRDKSYLQWRYLNHPKFKYHIFHAYKAQQIAGILIIKIGKFKNINTCFICDFFVDKFLSDCGYLLLKRLESFLKKKKINVVGCIMLKDKKESKILKKCGYRVIPSRIIGKEFYFVANYDQKSINKESLLNKDHWFVTWGDSDIV